MQCNVYWRWYAPFLKSVCIDRMWLSFWFVIVFVFIVCIHPWNSNASAFHVQQAAAHRKGEQHAMLKVISFHETTTKYFRFDSADSVSFSSFKYNIYHINRSNVSSYFIEFYFPFASFNKSTEFLGISLFFISILFSLFFPLFFCRSFIQIALIDGHCK